MKSNQTALFSVIGILTTFYLFGFDQYSIFAYHREMIAEGQYWRLITAHFTHLNLLHALLNAAAVFIIIYFFSIAKVSNSFALLLVLLSSLAISISFWLFSPTLTWYVGFSGVVHGLLSFVFFRLAISSHIAFAFALLLLFLKVVYEQCCYPDYLSAHLEHPVVFDAHLYGFLSGLLFSMLSGFFERFVLRK